MDRAHARILMPTFNVLYLGVLLIRLLCLVVTAQAKGQIKFEYVICLGSFLDEYAVFVMGYTGLVWADSIKWTIGKLVAMTQNC